MLKATTDQTDGLSEEIEDLHFVEINSLFHASSVNCEFKSVFDTIMKIN